MIWTLGVRPPCQASDLVNSSRISDGCGCGCELIVARRYVEPYGVGAVSGRPRPLVPEFRPVRAKLGEHCSVNWHAIPFHPRGSRHVAAA
jgi:hypothetical protein